MDLSFIALHDACGTSLSLCLHVEVMVRGISDGMAQTDNTFHLKNLCLWNENGI